MSKATDWSTLTTSSIKAENVTTNIIPRMKEILEVAACSWKALFRVALFAS